MQIILRTALFYLGYVGVPVILLMFCSNIISYLSNTILVYSVLLVLLLIFIYYVVCFFRLAISKKIFYEKWSKTRMVSTTAEIEIKNYDENKKKD